MEHRTTEPPFPDACRAGHLFIMRCPTATIHEFLVDGTLRLAPRVAKCGSGRAARRGFSERRQRRVLQLKAGLQPAAP